MVKTKTIAPSPEMVAFFNDLKAVLIKHKHLSAEVMLAGTSQLVGNLIALQDARKYSEDAVLHLVQVNIETGNREAIRACLPAEKRE